MPGRLVIYTSITGNYDTLQQPFMPAEGIDFICFVARGAKRAEYDGAWKIIELPYDWDDMTLLARSCKMNPQSMLPEEYDYSLWIDGNIRITDGSLYDICCDLMARDVRYAGVAHPFRDCVYDEAVQILRDRRESLWVLLKAVTFLRRHHHPEHAGLMENNIIFRKHNDPVVMEFDRWWWECFLKFPRRDQLTQSFALEDTPEMTWEYIFPKGTTARNFPGVEYIPHPFKQLTWLQRKLKYGLNKPEALILKAYIAVSRLIFR